MKKGRNKSWSLALACILLSSMLLTACGGGGSSSTGGGSSAEVSQANSEISHDKELTVMCPAFVSPEQQQEVQQYAEKTLGATVTFEAAPLQYADTVNKVTTMLASGDDTVDVYHIDEIMMLAFLSAGFLEPVDDVVPIEFTKDILPGYAEKFLVRDNKLYGVPADFGGIFFYVNKKMFDDAGVKIPTNQEEFVAAAQTLTKDGKWGLIESWDKASHLQDNLNRWSLMFGGNYLDWTNPQTQEAIKFMYALAQEYKVVSPDSVSDTFETGNQKMNDGLGAMYFQWASYIQSAISSGKYGEEIVVAPMPTFKTNHTPMSSWMFVVNKNSGKKELAKEFLKMMTEPEASALFQRGTWLSPTANLKAWDDPKLTEGLNAIAEHKQYEAAGSMVARDLLVKQSEFMDTATGTLQRYLLNEISFEDCIKQGQKQIDALK